MNRAPSPTWRRLTTWRLGCLVAWLVLGLLSSTAFADKPTIAILGLEVVDASGNIDQASIQVAKELTDSLRARAKTASGSYRLIAGGDKELIDEKLINNCENEAVGCMSAIGKNLGAQFLLYGRVEKKSDGYVVTVNLLNVERKKFEKAKTPVTIHKRDSASLAAAARSAYNDLTGVTENGTLVVTANVDRGTVLLDDEPRGTLSSGTAKITGLKENRYRLVIEADGFQRSPEVVVTIRSGETTSQSITMSSGGSSTGTGPGGTGGTGSITEVSGSTSTPSSGMGIWKPAFFVSLAGGLALTGYSIYQYSEVQSLEGAGYPSDDPNAPKFTNNDCDGGSVAEPARWGRAAEQLGNICSARNKNIKSAIAAGVVGLVVVGTGYMAFFRGKSERSSAPTSASNGRRTKKKSEFLVTPIVSANGGGATFQIDF